MIDRTLRQNPQHSLVVHCIPMEVLFTRTGRGGEPDRGQENKGIRRAKGLGSQGPGKIKEDRGASLFLHQIVDFAPAHFAFTPTPTQPVF